MVFLHNCSAFKAAEWLFSGSIYKMGRYFILSAIRFCLILRYWTLKNF